MRPYVRTSFGLANVVRRQAANQQPAHALVRSAGSTGASEVQFARWLLESRPQLTRIPDQNLIVTDRVPTSVPGAGRYFFAAMCDLDGSYAMVYAPVGRKFKVRMGKLTGSHVRASWYNPRNGQTTTLGTFDNRGEREFTPPAPGEYLDWVLVLDDLAKNYPSPGSRK